MSHLVALRSRVPPAWIVLCQCAAVLLITNFKLVDALAHQPIESIPATEILSSADKLLLCPQQPILISGAFTEQERRKWWKHIQTRSKNELVRVERQTTDDLILEQELIHALELILASQQSPSSLHQEEPIYMSSIGSSCSIDQLPIYEQCQDFFSELDLLPLFSEYTPMHDQLIVSSNQAISTLSVKLYTSLMVSLGGSPIQWWLEPQTPQSLNEYKSSRAITRTWEGNDFSMGYNSACHIIENVCAKSTVLHPGDILVIPPQWWCQSRSSKQANISIHSKRCGSKEFQDFSNQILPNGQSICFTGNGSADEIVQELFDRIEKRI